MTQKRQLTAYDVAEHYDDAYFDDLAQRYRQRTRFARCRIANVLSLLPELDGRRLLDLGCGMGTFTLEAAKRGARAIGVDPAPAAVAAAKRVAQAESIRGHFLRADAVQLPFRDGSVDIVLAADLTEHLDTVTLQRMLAEARRVLNEKGTLVIYTPERAHFFEQLRERGVMKQDPSHIGVRTARDLAALVRNAGFGPVHTRHLPSHLPVLNTLESGLGRWIPLLRRRIGLTARKAAR
jgi:ubiquinone/menaquinone biosynthesis C-methylase UbiE